MSQFESIYNQCVQLSIESSKESLTKLIRIYLNNNKEVRKTAKTAIKKTKNRQIVFLIIDDFLDTATGDKEYWLLQLGMSLSRKKYIKLFIKYIRENNVDISSIGLQKSFQSKPLSDVEKSEIADYIIDYNDYDRQLMAWAGKDNTDRILEKAFEYSVDNGFSESVMELLANNDDYAEMLQEELYSLLLKTPDKAIELTRFLDFSLDYNYDYLTSQNDLFVIYGILKNNKYRDEILNLENFFIRVSICVCKQKEINAEDWKKTEEIIKERIDILDDFDSEKNFLDFIKNLRYLNRGFVEQQFIEIYKRTRLYTDKALQVLAEMKSQYAYREMVSFMLTSEDRKTRYKYAVQLMRKYRENASSIYSYARELGDDNLLITLDGVAERLEIDLSTTDNNDTNAYGSNELLHLVPHDIIVSEYLFELAKKIHANHFYASVGFVFASGLKMLQQLFDYIRNNDGEIELIAGSLQTFDKEVKNNKIDKSTAIYIDRLIQTHSLKLFTLPEAFYHGKFYYVANDDIAYIVIGSSNISKTAYIDNYELDAVIEKDISKDDQFIEWYQSFKDKCVQIPYLDIEKYDELNWESELEIYSRRIIRKMTENEVRQKITELSDEETRFRLNLWMGHNPSEIFTDLSVASLPDYIVFLFAEIGMAVFESFVPGNAYYTFRYFDFDALLNSISGMTKKQMSISSTLLHRGYHISDQDRLEQRIDKLFY